MPEPGNPQALNRYSMVLNNPLKYTDPTGHSVDCGLGDAYCKAGKLDVGRRAIELAKSLGKQKVRYDQITGRQRSILDEGGIANERYYDAQQTNVGPIRKWLDENLAPDAPALGRDAAAPLSGPLIELTAEQAEVNSWAVYTWDVMMASVTAGGWLIIGLGGLTMDLPAAGLGVGLTNVASLGSTVSVLDTVATSGVDSNAYMVASTTYGLGWSSLAVEGWPVDLAMAYIQVAYDAYSIDYMYRHPIPRLQ